MTTLPSEAEIEVVFTEMRKQGRSLSKHIALNTQLPVRVVNPCLSSLFREGRLDRVMTSNGWFYRLTDLKDLDGVDKGLLATREGAAWTVMRRFSSFSIKDVEVLMAGTGFEGHQRFLNGYVRGLVAAGVLALRVKAKAGRAAQYQLVKDVGPLPPQRKTVALTYDPNAGVYVDADLVLT